MSYFNNLRKVIANQSKIPTDGLISRWKLDEDPAIHNTVIEDSVGGNNGTLITNDGSTNKSVVGQVGKAIDFDGSDDYVEVSYIGDQLSFSIAGWFKTIDNNGSIFVKGRSRGTLTPVRRDWDLYFANGNLNYLVADINTNFSLISKAGLEDGSWHHFAATYNQSNGACKLYTDNTLQGSDTLGGTRSNTQDRISFAGDSTSTGESIRMINAVIDDLLLYGKELSVSEIDQIYNA